MFKDDDVNNSLLKMKLQIKEKNLANFSSKKRDFAMYRLAR